MNKEITNYFQKALISSEHPVISFKDNNYVSFTFDEIKNNTYEIGSNHKICELLFADEFCKLFGDLSEDEKDKIQQVDFNCITSYKTLKTNFFMQNKVGNLPELTGVFYFSFSITFIRNKDSVRVCYNIDKSETPWFAEYFLSPNFVKNIPIIADVSAVDAYKSNTTEKRNKINSWNDYLNYCDEFFNSTADLLQDYENKCFVFRKNLNKDRINDGFLDLYKCILSDKSEHNLYNNFTDLNRAKIKPLISNIDVNALLSHSGHMNGKYSLADSQRQVLHNFNNAKDGDIIAVSGPPGTGKTTLLQSIVADIVVDKALKNENPPVIVATSANNQAVTNIIDSFYSISNINILNLGKRWINGVKSFATYIPAYSKIGAVQQKGYQYTTVKDRDFIQAVEDEIENSVTVVKKEAQKYFETSFLTVDEIKSKLFDELKIIDQLRRDLILTSVEIDKISDNTNIFQYIENLTSKKNTCVKMREKFRVRLKQWNSIYKNINYFKRILSFIPFFKKQISYTLATEISAEESDFFNKDISISEINKIYSEKIVSATNIIADLDKKIIQADSMKDRISNIIDSLISKNCSIPCFDKNNSEKYRALHMSEIIDLKIRCMEFWLAIHVNECRFLNREFTVTERQKGTSFESVLQKFYWQIALISPCFVMTTYQMPKNFKIYNNGYMFDFVDLLIFDEAGQCSPEMAAANFSLAKKALILGDECQIPPVYNLDLELDILSAVRSKIISDESEFDKLIESGLSCSQGNVMKVAKKSCHYKLNEKIEGLFLTEHRRCYDQIIFYCNELLYKGMLKPFRNFTEDKKNIKRLLDEKNYPYMGYFDISSSHSQIVGTSRRNEHEAQEISKWFKLNYDKICNKYLEKKVEKDLKKIFAVLTPFNVQAALIKKYLKEELGDKADNITVGTVHTLQGAEKNIIIFSTVYGFKDSGFFIDNNKNLMNVAVSRAKDAFWVFGCLDFLKFKSSDSATGLLYKMIKDHPVKS